MQVVRQTRRSATGAKSIYLIGPRSGMYYIYHHKSTSVLMIQNCNNPMNHFREVSPLCDMQYCPWTDTQQVEDRLLLFRDTDSLKDADSQHMLINASYSV